MSDKRKRRARLIQDLVEESTGARPSYCAVLNCMERAKTEPLTLEEVTAAGGTATEALAARVIAGRIRRAPRPRAVSTEETRMTAEQIRAVEVLK